ncbi:hypothetical protein D3C86_1831140 [compost metagenome]
MIVGTKDLWTKWSGEEPRETYKLAGRALLDISTSEGNYTQELDLDITLEEIPF